MREIFADEQRKLIDNRVNVLDKTDCKGCEYWRLCHGGCPLDAYNGYKDYNRKTDQCLSRKIFLKKYFEPITGLKLPKRDKKMSNRIDYLTPERMADEKPIWIDPVGGLGDILMLSTAMKRAFDKYDKKFHLSRRTHYTQFSSAIRPWLRLAILQSTPTSSATITGAVPSLTTSATKRSRYF